MVNGTFCEEVRSILSEVKAVRDGQNSSESILGAIQVDNKSLWRDVAILRSQHHKQRRVIEKLIQFLLSLIQRRSNMVAKKRKVRLMIDASARSAGTPGSASSDNGSAGFVDGGYVSPSGASLNGERPISASPSSLAGRNDPMGVAYANQPRPMSVSSSPTATASLMGSQFANQNGVCHSPKARICGQLATSGSPPIGRFLGANSNGNGCTIQAELANSIGSAGQQWTISTNHSGQPQQQQQPHQQQQHQHQHQQQQQYSAMPTAQANDVGGQANFGGQHMNTCCSNSIRQEPIWW